MERRDEELTWELDSMTEADRAEAVEIEAALGSYYAQENAIASNGARASFATIHQQLMREIEADVCALDIAPEAVVSSPEMIMPALTGGALQSSNSLRSVSERQSPTGRKTLGSRWNLWGLDLGRLTAMTGVVVTAAWGGHYVGRTHSFAAPVSPPSVSSLVSLPVQSLENDFDATLHASAPVEFVSDNGDQAASWLSQQTGRTVRLPALSTKTTNQLHLLGASRRALGGLEAQAVVQAHYQLPGGARVTLYQVRAPHLGLVGLREERVKGQSFFIKRDGRYRTVVWRSGDDLAAIVSPLGTQQSLQLAASLRAAQPSSLI